MAESNSEVAGYDGRAGEPLVGLEQLPQGIRDAVQQAEVHTRFDIQPGTIVKEPVLRADEIVFHEGGDLTLATPESPIAVLWGRRVHFQNGTVQSTVRVATALPVNGTPGAAGPRGRHGGSWGDHGTAGGPGANGTPGSPEEARVPTLVFVAGEVSFDREPTSGASPLALEGRGVDGGNGGAGGPGGAGGDGHEGRPGHEEIEPPLRF